MPHRAAMPPFPLYITYSDIATRVRMVINAASINMLPQTALEIVCHSPPKRQQTPID